MQIGYFVVAFGVFVVLANIVGRLLFGKKVHFEINLISLLVLSSISLSATLIGSYANLGIVLNINAFSLFFMTIFSFAMVLVNVIAYVYSTDYQDFALLSSFALLGMYIVSMSTSLITIFLGLEMASIPAVFMLLLSRKSLEAAVKFFIMASIAVSLFSFAMALVYGGANSLSLSGVQRNSLTILASVLFIAAIGFDASIFPFNIFIPDVYQGAPAYLTAMLGGVNKKMGFAALIQVMIILFISFKSTFLVIALLSVFTMIYGNIVAMKQNNLKRMLAYSSIAQAGYIMIGVATTSQFGIEASLVQIVSHMFVFIGLFGIIAWLEFNNRKSVDDIIGLGYENRFAAFSLTLFMLALVGLPFTTGFIGKFLLFTSAIKADMVWLAIIGIINSVMSIYYYARPIMASYEMRAGTGKIRLDFATKAVVFSCLMITLLLGIYPQPLIHVSNLAATYLFAHQYVLP